MYYTAETITSNTELYFSFPSQFKPSVRFSHWFINTNLWLVNVRSADFWLDSRKIHLSQCNWCCSIPKSYSLPKCTIFINFRPRRTVPSLVDRTSADLWRSISSEYAFTFWHSSQISLYWRIFTIFVWSGNFSS